MQCSCGPLLSGTWAISAWKSTPHGRTRCCGQCLRADLWRDSGASAVPHSSPNRKRKSWNAPVEPEDRNDFRAQPTCGDQLISVDSYARSCRTHFHSLPIETHFHEKSFAEIVFQ